MKNLIVIDMQNDFIHGPLGTPEAKNVERAIAQWIRDMPYDNVYLTRDTHFDDYFSTQEGRKLPIKHCIYQTEGWMISRRIWEELALSNIPRCIFIDKYSFGYKYWRTRNLIKDFGNDTIDIVGVCTDICVITNALLLKTIYPEGNIRVLSWLCAGTTPEMHEKALDIMRSCQINVR